MTNAELIEALQTDIREVEDDPVKTLSLMWRAADALEAAEKRIAELEKRLPKEGEWLHTDAFPHRIYCSVCFKTYVPNDRWQIWVDDELPKNYCPNCGAKMRGEQE